MAIFNEKNKNGLLLIKSTFKAMYEYKFIGVFSLAVMIINVTVFALFIDFEYQQYGVHIFDDSTLFEFLKLDFWGHLGHVLSILGLCIFFTINSLFFRFMLSYQTTERLKGTHPPLHTVIMVPFNHYKELLRTGIIYGLGAVKSTFVSLYPDNILGSTQDLLAGKEEELSNDNYLRSFNILLIPVIIKENHNFLTAIDKSEMLFKKTFGNNVVPNYSFSTLYRLLGASSLVGIVVVFHFILQYHIFTAIIMWLALFMGLINIIESVNMIFDSAVYNYCKGLPIGIIKPELITYMFTKK